MQFLFLSLDQSDLPSKQTASLHYPGNTLEGCKELRQISDVVYVEKIGVGGGERINTG